MELLILGIFSLFVLSSVLLGFSILYALLAGLILFLSYAYTRGFRARGMAQMVLRGIRKARTILVTFLLIGCMTALWRSAGTIAGIVSFSIRILNPKIVVLCIFLLNCLVSFMIGTAYGTAATIGVITASIAVVLKLPLGLTGGAILAGCYFGDRCSPVSTSMLLCSELTGTDPYRNIRTMFLTAFVPFLLSCGFYLIAGLSSVSVEPIPDMRMVFARSFDLHPLVLLPAAVILILALLRCPVKKAMLASILTAIPVCLFLQDRPLKEVLLSMILGFRADDPGLSSLIDGGGVISMLRSACIVGLSSSYAGIFEATGLLEGIRTRIQRAARKTNGYTATMLASFFCSMVACNQTLTIMLTSQLCDGLTEDRYQLASWLEDTAVCIPALIPWSITGTVVLYSCGLDLDGIPFSVFLYLVPLWSLLTNAAASRRKSAPACT